ncbi:MAG: non-canonical purine NTP pyrophosphatase [Pirellulales bacterium]|nr:non-canonical purine NTP pyrophosphatase [Pirellulales bacterium]
MRELVLGTHNRKKGLELAELLSPLGIELRTLADFPQALEVVEDGDRFAANARKKAGEQARHLGRWVLGEDSGLAVDALEGRPGIYSARFAGPQATDEANNQRLLDELRGVPPDRRTAHYVCHAVVADPAGHVRAEAAGYCRGRIRTAPAGPGGFGYDPLFEIVEYHRTFGELGPAVKAALSHRSRAIALLLPALRKLIASGASR